MKYYLLITSLLFLSACQEDVVLSPVCGNFQDKCWAVWTDKYQDPQLTEKKAELLHNFAKKNGIQGICSLGTPTCDEQGDITDCKGAIYPERYDICDNLDNDCDGSIDEESYPSSASSWWYSYDENPCPLNKGVCYNSSIKCIHGTLTCILPDTYEEGEELSCDFLDNDCDGLVDNITFSCTDILGNLTSCACYSGPVETERHGICRSGWIECWLGQVVCTGEQLPQVEKCDGLDNNCDGMINNIAGGPTKDYDIVLILDTSGSMNVYLETVGKALESFLVQFENNPHFRFSIVIITKPEGGLVSLEINFTNLSDVIDYLSNITPYGSYNEASLDGLFNVCENRLPLSWRESAEKRIFIFSDEPLQSFTLPYPTINDVIDSCSDIPIYTWSKLDSVNYDLIASSTGGEGFRLEFGSPNLWSKILDDLNSVFGSFCEE